MIRLTLFFISVFISSSLIYVFPSINPSASTSQLKAFTPSHSQLLRNKKSCQANPKTSTPTDSNQQFKLTAERILNDLIVAIGYHPDQRPSIRIVKSNDFIAHYLPGTEFIELEERLADVCQRMGKDSLATLAFIIGHELGHHFQNTTKGTTRCVPFLHNIGDYPEKIKTEKEADIHGIFVAYISGYLKSGDIVPAMIEQLYEAFCLEDRNLPQYDSLQQRKLIAEEVKAKADTLRHVFELGKISLLLGEYNIGHACFNNMLDYYQGPEIYNNLGLCYALAELKAENRSHQALLYPFEMDISSKLNLVRTIINTKEKSVERDQEQKRNFKIAMNYFDAALERNPKHLSSIINKYCLFSHNDKIQEAQEFYATIKNYIPINHPGFQLATELNKLKSTAKQNQDLNSLKNIAKKDSGNLAQLATYNLALLQKKEWCPPPPLPCPEKLNHKSISKHSNQFQLYPFIPLFELFEDLEIGWEPEKDFTRWLVRWQGEDRLHLLDTQTPLIKIEYSFSSQEGDLDPLNTNWQYLHQCKVIVAPYEGYNRFILVERHSI